MYRKPKPRIKICEWCGKEFLAKTKYVKTCCSKCSRALAAKVCGERNKRFKRVYSIDDEFLNQESSEKYYFLGLMAADGCLCDNGSNSISISQSGKEGLNCLNYIKNILKCENPIYQYLPPKGKLSNILSFRSNSLWKILCENNVTPRKTYDFMFPDYILKDENKLRYFLIGYIDGDGSIGVYKNMLCISFVGTLQMTNQLRNLPVFKKARFRRVSSGSVIECRFNGVKAIEFGSWLYKDITVYKSYKYEKFIQYLDNRYEISKMLKFNELREQVFDFLNKNPETTSGEIIKYFNIDKERAYKLKYVWRKKHGYIK